MQCDARQKRKAPHAPREQCLKVSGAHKLVLGCRDASCILRALPEETVPLGTIARHGQQTHVGAVHVVREFAAHWAVVFAEVCCHLIVDERDGVSVGHRSCRVSRLPLHPGRAHVSLELLNLHPPSRFRLVEALHGLECGLCAVATPLHLIVPRRPAGSTVARHARGSVGAVDNPTDAVLISAAALPCAPHVVMVVQLRLLLDHFELLYHVFQLRGVWQHDAGERFGRYRATPRWRGLHCEAGLQSTDSPVQRSRFRRRRAR